MIAVPVIFSGCYRVSNYTGDGQLIDNGARAATDRYVLDLGSVDLTHRGTRTFRIANLPEVNFVVGFEIVAPDNNNLIERKAASPTVSIELASPDGKILFAKKAPLDAWTWAVRAGENRAFVYGREEPATYFDAAPKTEYTLTLTVFEPDQKQSKYMVSLMAKSGGWK